MIVYTDYFVILSKGNTRAELEQKAIKGIEVFKSLCTQLDLTTYREKQQQYFSVQIFSTRYLNTIFKLKKILPALRKQ